MEPAIRKRFCRLGVYAACAVILVASAAYAHAPAKQAPRGWRQVTQASWYGADFHGRRTASGSRFNARHLTAAHPTLRFGTRVKVTALGTGHSVVVRITDRGPYVSGRGIDLSYEAARQLGIVRRGVVPVRIEMAKAAAPPPIVIALSGPATAWQPRGIVP